MNRPTMTEPSFPKERSKKWKIELRLFKSEIRTELLKQKLLRTALEKKIQHMREG